MLLQKIATNTLSALGCFLIFLLLEKNQLSFYGGARMGKIFQLGGLCSLCSLLATRLITRQLFRFVVKIAQFLSLLHISTSFWWHHVSTGYYVSHMHEKNNRGYAENCYHYIP